jgi:hypothetical protein
MWFEYLCKVIDLFESSFLTYAVDENKRTLIPIANYSLRIYRRYMSPIELVLNIIQVIPLILTPCDSNLRRSPSY